MSEDPTALEPEDPHPPPDAGNEDIADEPDPAFDDDADEDAETPEPGETDEDVGDD